MFGVEEKDPRLQAWLQQQQQPEDQNQLAGAGGFTGQHVQAQPDARPALPQYMPPGMQMPAQWAQQRQDPAWMAQNAPNGGASPVAGAAQALTAQPGASVPGRRQVPAGGDYDPSGGPVAQAAPAGGGGAGMGAAAAGAGAGALGMTAAPYLGVLASFLQKRQGDNEARRQQIASIYAQEGARNGAPQYGVEAARTQHNLQLDPGMDYLAPILKRYGQG